MPEVHVHDSDQHGRWILLFTTKPANLDTLPAGSGPGTKGEAMRQHHTDCFKKLDEKLEGVGIQIESRGKSIGYAILRGNEQTCQTFKAAVEKEGFAKMTKDFETKVIY